MVTAASQSSTVARLPIQRVRKVQNTLTSRDRLPPEVARLSDWRPIRAGHQLAAQLAASGQSAIVERRSFVRTPELALILAMLADNPKLSERTVRALVRVLKRDPEDRVIAEALDLVGRL